MCFECIVGPAPHPRCHYAASFCHLVLPPLRHRNTVTLISGRLRKCPQSRPPNNAFNTFDIKRQKGRRGHELWWDRTKDYLRRVDICNVRNEFTTWITVAAEEEEAVRQSPRRPTPCAVPYAPHSFMIDVAAAVTSQAGPRPFLTGFRRRRGQVKPGQARCQLISLVSHRAANAKTCHRRS